RHADLRGNERDPADRDRPRAAARCVRRRCRLGAAMHSSSLARSFVVTVALSGCSGTTTSNPPPPEPTPEPAPVSVVVEEEGPFATPSGDPTTAPTTGPDETAPTATVVSSVVKGKIMKRDGACFW